LTESRGPDSPGAARAASSVRRTSSSSSPQPPAAAAAAAGAPGSQAAATAGDEARSPGHVTAGAPALAGPAVQQRFSPAVSMDAGQQPQRAGSYHGELRAKNRFADSPLRASSLDTAGRVRTV